MEMKPITLEIAWEDLFGGDFTAAERRERWAEWLRIANEHEGNTFWEDYYGDISGCADDEGHVCGLLDGSWCSYVGLPCTMNPFLTFRHGILGMACMGCKPETDEQIGMW